MELDFNEDQKQAFGRALSAFADQVYNESNDFPKCQNVTIDLDNDDNSNISDYEMLGDLYSDSNNSSSEVEIVKHTDVTLDQLQQEKNIHQQNVLLTSGKEAPSMESNLASENTFVDVRNADLFDDTQNENYIKEIDIQLCAVEDAADGGISNDLDLTEKKDKFKPIKGHRLGDPFTEFFCPKCGVSCSTLKNWKAHTDIVHNFCSISELNMQTIVNRKGDTTYQCRTCTQKFTAKKTYSFLLNHRIKHMPYPNFMKCRICAECFDVQHKLLQHLKRKHKDVFEEKKKDSGAYICYIRFKCPICKVVCANAFKWREHLKVDHEWDKKAPNTIHVIRKNLVECNICESQFTPIQIKNHVLLHTPHHAFYCKICDKFSSDTIQNCVRHIRRVHFGMKLTCTYCDITFKNTFKRKQHIIENHAIDGVQCEVCKKNFINVAYLLSHISSTNHQKLK